MKRVVAIACGLKEPKKDYSIISKRNLYLNYGLLGLCTLLKQQGYEVEQFQGEYWKPYELIEKINDTEFRLDSIEYPVIISIVSFLSLQWCQEITRILKVEYGLKCIVGGKYVVDGNIEWLKRKLPYVDLFIEGAGERKIVHALSNIESNGLEYFGYYNRLDYSLLSDYKLYNPSIELARGCGRGCAYCADGNKKKSSVKDANSVIDELHFVEQTYDYEDFNIYFQMATFQVEDRWIELYRRRMCEFDKIFYWRCTSRIDALDLKSIPKLGQIGMRVLDLGLESASHRQLKLMKKTTNPKDYLQKAEEILHVAYESGIWVKLNVLLTAGETYETLTETMQWLDKNRKYIKGISANCETIYGPYNHLLESLKPFGATYVCTSDLEEKGYSYINLSDEINYDLAKTLAKDISRTIMTADDYYDLKKYGYFPRDYSRKQFLIDLNDLNQEELPFKIYKGG